MTVCATHCVVPDILIRGLTLGISHLTLQALTQQPGKFFCNFFLAYLGSLANESLKKESIGDNPFFTWFSIEIQETTMTRL